MIDQPNAADMTAFGASDYACYRWPGEEDQALRAAFCEGAAHAVSRHAPRVPSQKDEMLAFFLAFFEGYPEGTQLTVTNMEALERARAKVVALSSTESAPAAPDIESLCRDYAQRWLWQDWPMMDDREKAELRIEAHRWIKCWSAAEPAPRALNSCPCGAGEEPCPGPDGKPLCAVASTGTLVGWMLTWPDGERSFYSKSKPVPTRGQIITPIYGPAVSSTERSPTGG